MTTKRRTTAQNTIPLKIVTRYYINKYIIYLFIIKFISVVLYFIHLLGNGIIFIIATVVL